MSELRHQEIIDRVHHMYLQTDGTIEFPNSFEGDLLKIAYGTAVQSIKQPQLNENQQKYLKLLKRAYEKFGNVYDGIFFSLVDYEKRYGLPAREFFQVLDNLKVWAIEQEEAK
ncbi:hypothetical protein ACIJDN_000376 [Enterococcus faecalis]